MKTTLAKLLITTTLIIRGIHSQCLLPRVPIPFTTLCQCPNVWKICQRPKYKDVFCQCACIPDLTCTFPKAQNQDDCECKCKLDYDCPPPKYQDVDSCDCICPKKSCSLPKVQSQTSCNCECPNKGQECPLLKKFDDLTCSCQCKIKLPNFNPDKVWDPVECKYVPIIQQPLPNNQNTAEPNSDQIPKELSEEDFEKELKDLELEEGQIDENGNVKLEATEEELEEAEKEFEESVKQESEDQQK